MGRSRPKFPERCHLSTYTEFGPDRLRFAGLIPESLIFRLKKSIQYRLLAYKNKIKQNETDEFKKIEKRLKDP